MSKEMAVVALGVWIIIETQLGVPSSWHTVLLVITGLGVAAVGLLLRAEALSRGTQGSPRHPFVENSVIVVEEYSEPEDKDILTSLN